MAVIRKDSYGLYLKAGGYYFRPLKPVGNINHKVDFTKLNIEDVGSHVKSRYLGGNSLCSVKYFKNEEEIKEYWYAHGNYMGNHSTNNSEEAYKPEYENW